MVGYAGGTSNDPTYHDLAGAAETVQVDFDPSKVTYEELVEKFFSFHDATLGPSTGQYRTAIFAGDAEQERIARSVVQREQANIDRPIKTQIVSGATFYLAEDYHQKYALQGNSLLAGEYRAIYPDLWDMVDSTAATRVNAYLYGEGSAEQLQAELDGLGLSEAATGSLIAASPVGTCVVDLSD
jgi:methionine-S-sulfoxide reductase